MSIHQLFTGKTALVTGASFGIGRAAAIGFAKRGASVVVADCLPADETVQAVRNTGAEVLYIRCDVSEEADVKAMIDATIRQFGKIDYAFNNAGIEGFSAPTHECTTDNWDRTINVNLKGVWLCMKYEIAAMLQAGKGVIVNNASIAGLVGFTNIPAYVASKHGIIGVTKNAALEYARKNIRVNAVCPGVIKTPMIDRFTGNNKEVEKQFAETEPVGRLGDPAEVADAVMWLCSDQSSFITGVALPVDGGWVAQ